MSSISTNTPGSAEIIGNTVVSAETSSVKIGDGIRTAVVTSGLELKVSDSTLQAKLPTLGQKVSSGSVSVVMSSDYAAPAQSVIISHTDDSIKLGDGTNLAGVSAAGALKVDGSAVTQPVSGPLTDAQLRALAVPVSGTLTSNIGTTNGLALDATLTGGTLKATARSGAKGTSTAADITSTAVDVNTQALDVSVKGTVTTTALTDAQLRATAVPVSAASLPLPSGAATEVTTAAINTKIPSGLTVTANRLQVELPAGGSGLTNTELRATAVPVSNASLPLPAGASTETTLAALNTKVPSGLVVTTGRLQVELPAGGSGLTNTELRATAVPVSGTLTSNIGTTNGLALDATLTGGTAKAIARTAAKGTTVAADLTSTPVDANTQALDVSVKGTVTTTALTDTQLRATAVPVSGTLTVNTGLTDTQLRLTPVPISGTVTTGGLTDTQIRATALPVSGTVTSNIGTTNGLVLDATLTGGTAKAIARGGAKGATVAADLTSTPVDANTQALDVSIKGTVTTTGTLTDTQLRATAVPVSGTLTVNTGLTDTQLRATAVPVSGTVSVTGVATETTLAALNTKVTAVNTGAVTISAALPTGANSIGTVVAPTITKGTQAVTGFTTQDLKDAGRNAVHYYSVIPVLSTATDTLQSLTGTKAGVTVTATTTPAVVTAAKTLRITRLSATYVATATSGYGIVRLRFNTAGVAAITSPIAATLAIGAGTPATANSVGYGEVSLSEGWEFAAATGIGVSVQGFAAVTATAVGYVMVSVTGYEY